MHFTSMEKFPPRSMPPTCASRVPADGARAGRLQLVEGVSWVSVSHAENALGQPRQPWKARPSRMFLVKGSTATNRSMPAPGAE